MGRQKFAIEPIRQAIDPTKNNIVSKGLPLGYSCSSIGP